MFALEGIRVLDLTQIMAGPFCARLLADLGAEVIKIERPQGGDDSRRMGFKGPGGAPLSFIAMNRNKYGIALDIRTAPGQAILRKLIGTADVLIENFRPGTMARLGFGYKDVRKYRPNLIYCSISGYGQTGPYADRGGFDLVAQAMSGIISVTGTPEHPAKSGVPLSDLNAGLFASHAILAALLYRERTGEGQHIDTSLLEGALAYTIWETNEYWATAVPPVGLGTAHRNSAPYQTFRTADGAIAIGAANQRNWERLARAMGRGELIEDPRFGSNADRLTNLPALATTLGETFVQRTTDEWLGVMEAAGVPAGPVLNLEQVYQHPQVQAREMDLVIEDPQAGAVHAIGMPVKYSRTPARIVRPAPLLGQHTFRVLRELGYAQAECAMLEEQGVILDAHEEVGNSGGEL
jgi:crotonobetainyl-CoA:carnitine CoA-transferase CaiB-like acyl-CoA transferase